MALEIKIPLHTGAYPTGLEGYETFEAGDDGIRLDPTRFSDDFNDNSIDVSKWNEADSASNINETNQRIEGKGNDLWYGNGLVTDNSVALAEGMEFKYSVTPQLTGYNLGMFGANSSSTLAVGGVQCCLLWFGGGSPTAFNVWLNTISQATAYTYAANKIYHIRIVYQSPGWKIYVQSPDDTNYCLEVEVFSTATASTGPMYSHANFHSSAGLSYLDDVSIEGYIFTSPATTGVWTALPAGILDMSTARLLILKDGVVQAATSTDVKMRYYYNNGGASSWLTLEDFRLESDITVTNITNSVKVETQYITDGSYQSASRAFLIMEFTPAVGWLGSPIGGALQE